MTFENENPFALRSTLEYEMPDFSRINDESYLPAFHAACAEQLHEVHEIIKQVTFDALEESGMDWYNNDGGQGYLTIDFNHSPPEIDLELGINHTATTDYSFSFNEEDEDAPMSP